MTPEGWRRAPLRDLVVEMNAGVSVNSEDRPLTDGEVGILKTSCVTSGAFEPSQHKAVLRDEVTRLAVPPRAGHIIMSRMNTAALVGASAYVEEDHPRLFLPDRLWQLRVSADCDARWLAYALGAAEARAALSAMATGTSGSMKNLTKDRVLGLPVLVPPLAEQRRIAAALSSVDASVERASAAVAQAEELRRQLADALVAGTTASAQGQGRPSSRWRPVRAGDLLATSPANGKSPPSRTSPPGVPTFSIAAVRRGEVNIARNLKFADVAAATVEAFRVARGDLLVVRGNANPDLVGRCGVVGEHPPGCIYPDILVRLRAGPEVRSAYLALAWNTAFVHNQLLARAKTTNGTYKLNQTDFCSVLVPVPPLDKQDEIVAAVGSVRDVARIQSQRLEVLRDLKVRLSSTLLFLR